MLRQLTGSTSTRLQVIVLVLAVLPLFIGCAASDRVREVESVAGYGAPDQDSYYVYACNQGEATISVIDGEGLEVVDTVDLQELGFSANAKPHHVAVEADGSFWYVSLIGEDTVVKFDRENNLVGRLEFAVPGMLSIDSNSNRLYVGRSMSAVNPPKRIGVIDRSQMEIDEIDVFFPRPHALTVSPDGSTVYSASLAVNQLARIDATTLELDLTNLGGDPHTLVQFAVSADGTSMVAGGQMSGQVLIFRTSESSGLTPVDSVQIGGMPWHPTFDHSGRYAYFGNKGMNTVTVVDVPAGEIATVISGNGLAEPHGSTISPDGTRLFVSNNNLKGDYTTEDGRENVGTVVVIDTDTHEIIKVIEVGKNTTGIAANTGV